MRPKQWTKNGIIFAALVFDGKLLHPLLLAKTTAAFAIFCLISSTVYLINDLVDIEKDRAHPSKCHRPLPSGQLRSRTALSAAIAIPLIFLPVSFLLGRAFGVIATTYLGLMIAYSFVLKNVVIIDVLTIAGGFVMRVAAGTVIFHVERFSPWLYVCTTLLALFLALSKRRQELVLLHQDANNHRSTLQDYSIPFLDEMIALVTSTTVMAYSLYTFSAPNLPKNHTMMLTIPFVLYGLFRYLYLIHARGEVKAPEELLLKDRALSISVALWGMASVAILSCAPPMYDELWTAAKCMYKLEPVLADDGELIIYAPHLREVCVTHGAVIREIGYHCRDYFLGQWERFQQYPRGVLAHSTHVHGLGTWREGVERRRARVTLATQIPEAECRALNLGYRDPDSIRPEDFANREDEGVLLVPKAGETLYRLKNPPAWAVA